MVDVGVALRGGARWLRHTRLTLLFCLSLVAVYAVELWLWTSGQTGTFYALFVARQNPSLGWLLAPLAHSPVQETHLVSNVAHLVLFGAVAERRLADRTYLGLIAASGVASVVTQVAVYAVAAQPAGAGTLGASGVAYALTALVVVDSLRYEAATDRWHSEGTWLWTLFGALLIGQALLEAIVGVPGVSAVGHFTGVLVGASLALARPRSAVIAGADGGVPRRRRRNGRRWRP